MDRSAPLALVTAAHLDVPDADRPYIDQALAARSMPARWVVWDDPSVDWSSFGAVWIRSPWDYTTKYAAFLAWVHEVGARVELWNPAAVVAWNSHKSYLLELADQGVAVVPTRLVPAGVPVDLAATMADQHWDGAVVKPAVSVGAVGAQRITRDQAGAWDEQDRSGSPHPVDRLVQPLVEEVADGEVSMIAIDGRITHAVRKVPAPGDFRVQIEHGGQELIHHPTPAERQLAQATLEAVGPRLLYARIDCVTTPAGPQLMELELIEPSLFLGLAPPSALEALTDAVSARL